MRALLSSRSPIVRWSVVPQHSAISAKIWQNDSTYQPIVYAGARPSKCVSAAMTRESKIAYENPEPMPVRWRLASKLHTRPTQRSASIWRLNRNRLSVGPSAQNVRRFGFGAGE